MELHEIDPKLRHYLDGYRLAYDVFEVVEIIPVDREFAAIVMHDKRPDSPAPYCVQYRGGGHYFKEYGDMHHYMCECGWI